MSDLHEHLEDLAPTARARALALEIVARTAAASARAANYVSLRPPLAGAIAVYLLRDKISIALPPDRADAVAPRLPGVQLQRRPPTTYLVMEGGALTRHAELLTQLAVEAVLWRADGPRGGSTGGPMTATRGKPSSHISPARCTGCACSPTGTAPTAGMSDASPSLPRTPCRAIARR